MKIAQINMTHNGSTGKIMFQIAEHARANGHSVKTFSPIVFSRFHVQKFDPIPEHFFWGSRIEAALHYYIGSLSGNNGRLSFHGTKVLLNQLDEFQPDIIHLHNLHYFCINLPTLFRYIKKNRIRVVWTLHDCWSFTGHCPHFILSGCEKWKTGCHHCKSYRAYPKSHVDDSRRMYKFKKKWFTGIDNLILVTPSQWLADLTRHSFLKEYTVKVINNGINCSVFSPRESDFRERYKCEEKKIILGVAFDWSNKKGLNVFESMAECLSDDYQIVLVGTNSTIDKNLPTNIISIHRTENQSKLADIYSAADVFVNPTREDTFPTVNMEALACGTPVITFRTGGSPEIVDDSCGCVVDNKNEMIEAIIRICNENPYSKEACVARGRTFDMDNTIEEYIKLYENYAHCTQCTI